MGKGLEAKSLDKKLMPNLAAGCGSILAVKLPTRKEAGEQLACAHAAVVEVEIRPVEGEVAALLGGSVVKGPLSQAADDGDTGIARGQVVGLGLLLLPIPEALAGSFQFAAELAIHIPGEGS
ncbi:MAG: hypothetical protein HY922_03205 [Elusimicrobia bacterium]|nr:hypothetical protein [Elusimicrobiota bacterium]